MGMVESVLANSVKGAFVSNYEIILKSKYNALIALIAIFVAKIVFFDSTFLAV